MGPHIQLEVWDINTPDMPEENSQRNHSILRFGPVDFVVAGMYDVRDVDIKGEEGWIASPSEEFGLK